jgi:hypothetical protein
VAAMIMVEAGGVCFSLLAGKIHLEASGRHQKRGTKMA